MNTNPTETRLREIASRENKATKGPWVKRKLAINTVTMRTSSYGIRTATVSQGNIHPEDQNDPDEREALEFDAAFIAHSRQDVPWLLKLEKKRREALEQIVSLAQLQCKQSCKQHYLPRGTHAPECPLELIEIARDALNFSPENL